MKKKEKKQKIKKERKPMSNTDKFMLVFLATLIIYLAIILPIRLCVVSFSWHWFVFGLVAVVIPFAFIHFQLWSQKKLAFTEAQKKNANVVTVKYILYFWFLDCLYMVIFNQWILWIYILGIITLVKIFYGLAVTFLGKKQKNAILDISIVFDFLLGVGLTVYLIYLIPDEFNNLQTIVTAIIAAVYGGLLTLVGVAWTIRKGDKDRKDEERIKYIPHFIPLSNKIFRGTTHSNIPIIDSEMIQAKGIKLRDKDFDQRNKIEDFSVIAIYLQNVSLYPCAIEKIVLNEMEFSAGANKWIEKESAFYIQLEGATQNFYNNKSQLFVCDILGNHYRYEILTNEFVMETIIENHKVL